MNTYYFNDPDFMKSDLYKDFIKDNPSTGFLRIRAYSANEALPVEGIKIRIKTDYKEKFGDAKIVNAHGDREGVTIIADYKLPHSKMTNLMIKSNFNLYSEYDLVKMVISDDEDDQERY